MPLTGAEILVANGASAQLSNLRTIIKSYDPHRPTFTNEYDVERRELIRSTTLYLAHFSLFKKFTNNDFRTLVNRTNPDFVEHIDLIMRFIYQGAPNDINPTLGKINVTLFNFHENHLSAISSITWLENFLNENTDFTLNNININEVYCSEKKNIPKHLKKKINSTKNKLRVLMPTDTIELYDVLENRKLARNSSAITSITSLFTAHSFADVSSITSEKTKFRLIPNTPTNNKHVGIQHVNTEKYLSYNRNISKMLWNDITLKTIFHVKISNNTINVSFDNDRQLRNYDYVKFECEDNKFLYLPSIYNYDRYTWNHVTTGNANSSEGKLCEIFVVRLVPPN